jgi:hypothetical protein
MNEDELRMLLEHVEPPPSGVDLSTVLREGHRGVRRRRYAVGGVTVATALAVLAVPATIGALRAQSHATPATVRRTAVASAPCPVTPLPMPRGTDLEYMTSVDPTGRYITGVVRSSAGEVGVLWTDRVPQLMLTGSDRVGRVEANVHGVVAGNTIAPHAYLFRYQDGHATPLRVPPGYFVSSTRTKINTAGDIVALVATNHGISAAARWPAGNDSPQLVRLTPASQQITAFADDGTMLGFDNARAPYLWDRTGQGIRLAAPATMTATPSGIRGSWVTGWLMAGDGTAPGPAPTPALWDRRTGKLVTDRGTVAKNAGWFVEFAYSKYQHRSDYLVFDNHGNEMRLATRPGRVSDAAAVTDRKLVVGKLYNGGLSGGDPVTWQC